MGERNTPEQTRGYSAAYKARMRKAGMVQVTVWCPSSDKARVQRFARLLVEAAGDLGPSVDGSDDPNGREGQ